MLSDREKLTVVRPSGGVRVLDHRLGSSIGVAQIMGHALPSVNERYELRRILGRGASGVVVEAFDDRLHRNVALKIFAELSERIVREGRALARLDHPNVVRVFDVGEGAVRLGDERPLACVYLATELIEGQSLRGWIESHPSAAEICAVLRVAGAGLAAAHEAGLI